MVTMALGDLHADGLVVLGGERTELELGEVALLAERRVHCDGVLLVQHAGDHLGAGRADALVEVGARGGEPGVLVVGAMAAPCRRPSWGSVAHGPVRVDAQGWGGWSGEGASKALASRTRLVACLAGRGRDQR